MNKINKVSPYELLKLYKVELGDRVRILDGDNANLNVIYDVEIKDNRFVLIDYLLTDPSVRRSEAISIDMLASGCDYEILKAGVDSSIRFRGVTVDTNFDVYGAYFTARLTLNGITKLHHFIIPDNIDISKGIKIEDLQREIKPETLSRYTGHTDKYGCDIYENHVLALADRYVRVVWDPELGQFNFKFIEYIENDKLAPDFKFNGIYLYDCSKLAEVVGFDLP